MKKDKQKTKKTSLKGSSDATTMGAQDPCKSENNDKKEEKSMRGVLLASGISALIGLGALIWFLVKTIQGEADYKTLVMASLWLVVMGAIFIFVAIQVYRKKKSSSNPSDSKPDNELSLQEQSDLDATQDKEHPPTSVQDDSRQ